MIEIQPQSQIQPDVNKNAKILIWISVSCYALTSFFPIVTYWFFFSFDAMIYDFFTEVGLAFFFGGLVCALFAAFSPTKPTRFKTLAFISAALSVLPIVMIFNEIGYFTDLNVGFYTYVGAAVTSLFAGITFKDPEKIQPSVSQPYQPIQQAQPIQQTYIHQPEQEPIPLQQQVPQNTVEENMWFCSNCGVKIEKTAKFCENCGFNLKEQE